MFNSTLHAMSALDRDDPNRVGDPPEYYDAPDDTRRQWRDLTQDQKLDEAVDYMREYTVRNGAQRASLLWAEALTQTKTTKGMVDYIGRVMVRAKSETWCL